MPFGMGPAGWCLWPYFYQYAQWSAPWCYPLLYQPYPQISSEQEIVMLENEKSSLEQRIKEINERLQELKKE